VPVSLSKGDGDGCNRHDQNFSLRSLRVICLGQKGSTDDHVFQSQRNETNDLNYGDKIPSTLLPPMPSERLQIAFGLWTAEQQNWRVLRQAEGDSALSWDKAVNVRGCAFKTMNPWKLCCYRAGATFCSQHQLECLII
jgi:hypothetical protein